MEKLITIGEALDQSIAKASAEMQSARVALSASLPMPGGLNPLTEMREHLMEAIDALLDGAAACGGEDHVAYVLRTVAARRGVPADALKGP